MIWGVVETYVFDIMVPFTAVRFEHGGLKYRRAHCALETGMLTGVDEFRIDVIVMIGQESTPSFCVWSSRGRNETFACRLSVCGPPNRFAEKR
jgi:hypothetical protein